MFGETQEEHDRCLTAVLARIKDAGLTLNRDKCQFNRTSIKFLGQVVDGAGIRPDPGKLVAIQEMKPPTNITELRRFIGMANQLTKFSPRLTDKMKPLRVLLSTKTQWQWREPQDTAFRQTKEALSSYEVLAKYDATKETVVSADASSYGLGVVLRQKQPDGTLRPTAYISRAMTETETRYAQIEKEALAVTWACERFQDYLIGMQFQIETDHKPLVPLFTHKSLDQLPLGVQRFRLRMMRFSYSISHVPGKDLTTDDTLSRAPRYIGPIGTRRSITARSPSVSRRSYRKPPSYGEKNTRDQVLSGERQGLSDDYTVLSERMARETSLERRD